MTYYYLYNGGGVATADLNNDGLDDLVFAGNMVPPRVCISIRRNMQFEDITESSGFNVQDWVMGVSVVDVNADGWNDIYLSVAGPDCPESCRNLLYINQGECDGKVCFEEQAEAYGLDDRSYSVHSTFLDYDRDGDLDMFLLTNIVNNINKSFIIDRTIKGK